VHHEIFKFFRHSFLELFNSSKAYFKRADSDVYYTREEYEALPLEEAFRATFPALDTSNWKTVLAKGDLDYRQMIYQLRIKSLTGYMEACHFCSDKRCEGCPLPYTPQFSYQDLLAKLETTGNNSFYGEGRGKKDIIIEVVWNQAIEKPFFA